MKTLLVGIDGLDYEFLTTLGNGLPDWLCAVPLESQIGLTGSEWTSMLTGIPVTTLGAYDYYGRVVGDDQNVVRYEDLEGYYLWEIAEASRFSTAICRAPACYPPRPPREGWILSGVGAHDNDDCFATSDAVRYPVPQWHESIESDPYAAGSIMHYIGHEPLHDRGSKLRLRRFCTGVAQGALCMFAERDGNDLITHFVKHSKKCDLGFFYFGLVDILLHNGSTLFDEASAVQPYSVVMEFVERLRNEVQPEQLFIISDHGGKAGKHRSCGVLAWKPTRAMPAVEGDVVLGEPRELYGGPRERTMVRVPVLEAPWHPWTYEVAEIVLRTLDLAPKRYGGHGVDATYTVAEQSRIHGRLKALGYC